MLIQEDYFKNIFNTVREAILILDENMRVLSANRSFFTIFKVDSANTIGSHLYDLGNGQWNIPYLRVLLEDILPKNDTVDDYEIEHNFESIGQKTMLLNACKIREKKTDQPIILLAIEDITERKRLEDVLEESEKRYRRVFETASDGIVLLEKREGKIINANPATGKMLGYSKEESIGKKLQDIGVSLDMSDFPAIMQALDKSDIINYDDVMVKTKSGPYIYADIYMVDRAKLAQCNIRDVTERKLAEEELIRSEKEYKDLFDSTLDGIYQVDADGVFISMNTAGARIFGYASPEEIIGKNALEHWRDPKDRDVFRVELKVKKMVSAYHMKAKKKTGEPIELESSSRIIEDDKGNFLGIEGILRDITERKQAEKELTVLYKKVKEEAEVSGSLLKMFEALNAILDEKQLITNVINLAPNYLKFDRIGMFIYDEELKGFNYSGGYGFSSIEEGILISRSFRRGDFPAIDIALKGETVIIDDASESDLMGKELVETLGITGAVIVPISTREKVVGGIYGDYKTLRPIEKKDVSFLKGLADGIAIALQNSRHYRESTERLMELTGKIETINAMSHIDKEILSTIDRAAILKIATALIPRIIPCERTAIALKEGDIYRITSEWGIGEFKGKTYSIKGSHFEPFERNHISLYLSDILEDDCPYHGEQRALGIKSLLVVPIVTRNGVIGFLDIGSAYHGRLTPEHLSTAEKIASQIAVALENARLYEEVKQLLINTITSLASAIDAKSPWTNGHSVRVTHYALQIGKEMGLNDKDVEWLRLSGLLHDVGKIGTYDIILDKPGKLTDEEFRLVKKHPGKGAEILNPITQLADIIPGVLHHHERYDGKGYPDGLKGEEIPLQARILCVADSFDSMTANRPYRLASGTEYAISEFKRCSGAQFDPKVVEAFLNVLGKPL